MQTVSQVTDTAVTVTLAEGVAKPHPAADIVVNVAGKLVIPPSFCAFFILITIYYDQYSFPGTTRGLLQPRRRHLHAILLWTTQPLYSLSNG